MLRNFTYKEKRGSKKKCLSMYRFKNLFIYLDNVAQRGCEKLATPFDI